MAIKKRGMVLTLLIACISLALIFDFARIKQYRNSYIEIELIELERVANANNGENRMYWFAITDEEAMKNFELQYGAELIGVNPNEDMLIVSVGARLQGMDYNKRESTFKSRGVYIGFPRFGEYEPDVMYVYKSKCIPLVNNEVGGFHPDYNGKYRTGYKTGD